MESADDGAVAVVKELQQECEGGAGRVSYRVAGLSKTCSQKIHNMVEPHRAPTVTLTLTLTLTLTPTLTLTRRTSSS